MKTFFYAVLMSCLVGACTPAIMGQLPELQKQEFERLVEEAMTAYHMVPGIGVAIVRGDQIVYADGFGFRDLENQLPVTAETGFYLASKSKSFLATAAAQLEQQGVIDLDASLASYFPNQNMMSSMNPEQITLVDLLSHNHSLQNGGIQFRLSSTGPIPKADRARVLFDFSRPRERGFEYSNTSFNTVGWIMEKESGKAWQEIVDETVFAPLGMLNTTASIEAAVQREFAYPYWLINNNIERLPLKEDALMQSAGGHVSTPMDMARWLLANINDGRLGGKQLLPAEVLKKVHHDYVDVEDRFFKFDELAYQLGWYRANYEGDSLLYHFGSYSGYMAHVSYMPEHDFGVVVLANELRLGAQLPHLIACFAYDVLLEKGDQSAKYQDIISRWQEQLPERQERLQAQVDRKQEILDRLTSNPVDFDFNPQDYVGTYYSPRIGHFRVEIRAQELWSVYGVKESEMLAFDVGSFLSCWDFSGPRTPPMKLDALYNENGQVVGISWEGREFRRLKSEIVPAYLNDVHAQFREDIETCIRLSAADQAESVGIILHQAYEQGALTEDYINQLGYSFIYREELQIAKAILKFNVEQYPNSANTYDSLGEVYLELGDLEKARQNYESALRLDPENETLIELLKTL